MINKAILMGRLTRDPELRYTQSNVPTCSFTVAIDRNYKSQSGERAADFINCVAWRQTAEFVSKWFTKGKMIVVVGSIQSRKYTDRDGNNRTAVEVVADEVSFGEAKREGDGGYQPNGGYQSYQPQARPAQPSYNSRPQSQSLPVGDFADLGEDDDDLPF